MATKVLRNGDISQTLQAVQVLDGVLSSVAFKLKLAEIAEVLERRSRLLTTLARKIQDKYTVRDADGNPVPRTVAGRIIDGSVSYTNLDAMNQELEELADLTAELELPEIKQSELDALPKFEGSIRGIRPLLAA